MIGSPCILSTFLSLVAYCICEDKMIIRLPKAYISEKTLRFDVGNRDAILRLSVVGQPKILGNR
uniref:Uncharacterized protein n=1 Tax=Romanomermis culicivorax TaxID=13658 RepID=A0A915KDL2_ROMCU